MDLFIKWEILSSNDKNLFSFRGKITIKDLVHSLFVGDFMKTVSMSGEDLVKLMEQSARKYDATGVTAPGSFLQVSGLRVVYDINKPPGHRVKKLLVRCKQCIEGYERVILNKTYSVAMPEFLAKGGDGYSRFNSSDPRDEGQPEIFLIVNYLKKMKTVKPVLDGRIAFVNPLNPNGTIVSPKFRDVSYKSTDELLDRDVGMTFSPIIPLISRTEKRNLTSSNTSSPRTEKSTSTSPSPTTSKSSSRPTTMFEIHEMSSASVAASTSEMHKTSSMSPEN
ncbi:snake venom 5'-nucleotidase [Caerostris extrusa]|uniref:5'-nucleotidase n=1 Tax=Caerostris extrusa TaxID=172846 RepID=A0AAV4QD77_CAEEX|nr:snake venom 5'-nucleotidase [Caerostris extrusa]